MGVRYLGLGLICTLFSVSCGGAPQPRGLMVRAHEPWVYVHLVGSDGALLQRKMDDDWVGVCRAPCRGPLEATGPFRIVADRASKPFTLPLTTGATVTLRADSDGAVYTLDSAAP
jgi:hypothetical protein